MKLKSKMRLHKEDHVMVITGKDKGKIGKILNIFTNKDRVIVEKVNIVKRHSRSTDKSKSGGIIEKEASIHISNLQLMCNKCNKPARIGYKQESNDRVRFCKKCNAQLVN